MSMQLTDVSAQQTPKTKRDESDRFGVRAPMVFGVLVILGMFGGIGAWAGFSDLARGVTAKGNVRVETERQVVNHLEGGIVKEILVSENIFVYEGEPLIVLDEAQIVASLESAEESRLALLVTRARLNAELMGADSFSYPEAIQEQLDDPIVQDLLLAEEELFEARAREDAGQRELLMQQKNQLMERIAGINAQLESLDLQKSLILEELDGLRELLDKGFVPKTRVLALERSTASIDGQVGRLMSERAQTREQIIETETRLTQVEKSRRLSVLGELKQTKDQLININARIETLKDRFNRLVIRSPHEGNVIDLAVHTRGEVIAPGMEVMQIVPADSNTRLVARVTAKDVEIITPGLPVEVRITSLGGGGKMAMIAPMLHGEVVEVSPDTIYDDRSGMAFYEVVARVKDGEMKKLGNHRVLPGMELDILFRSGTRTPLEYVLSPFTRIFEQGMVAP